MPTKKRVTNKQITANLENHKMYTGLDVHKESVQIAVVDDVGMLLFNKKISSRFSSVTKITANLPSDAKYVMESSSVWYGLYRQ